MADKYIPIKESALRELDAALMQAGVLLFNVGADLTRILREEAEAQEVYKGQFKLLSFDSEAKKV